MNKIAMIKGRGIEGLVSKYGPVLEESHSIKAAEDGLRRVIDFYSNLSHDTFSTSFYRNFKSFSEVLTPVQINAFLNSIRHDERTRRTGLFMSRLIQLSSDAGHNGFILTPPYDIHDICTRLRGTKYNPISVTIRGDVGRYFGAYSVFSDLTVEGATGGEAASSAQYSTFTIHGKINGRCGYDAWHTTLKTSDERNAKRLVKKARKQNRIVFIHPDGTEEVLRDAR